MIILAPLGKIICHNIFYPIKFLIYFIPLIFIHIINIQYIKNLLFYASFKNILSFNQYKLKEYTSIHKRKHGFLILKNTIYTKNPSYK